MRMNSGYSYEDRKKMYEALALIRRGEMYGRVDSEIWGYRGACLRTAHRMGLVAALKEARAIGQSIRSKSIGEAVSLSRTNYKSSPPRCAICGAIIKCAARGKFRLIEDKERLEFCSRKHCYDWADEPSDTIGRLDRLIDFSIKYKISMRLAGIIQGLEDNIAAHLAFRIDEADPDHPVLDRYRSRKRQNPKGSCSIPDPKTSEVIELVAQGYSIEFACRRTGLHYSYFTALVRRSKEGTTAPWVLTSLKKAKEERSKIYPDKGYRRS